MESKNKSFRELEVYEGVNYLRIGMEQRDILGNCMRGTPNLNLVEVGYRQENEDGVGAGGYEYITTMDISAMASGLSSVLREEAGGFEYVCQNDHLIKVFLKREADELFTFEISMLDTLLRDNYITVRKNNITRTELADYLKVFCNWKKDFPVMEEKATDLYEKAYNSIAALSCSLGDTRSLGDTVDIERIFNIGVDGLLENNDERFCEIMEDVIALKAFETDDFSKKKETTAKVKEALQRLILPEE